MSDKRDRTRYAIVDLYHDERGLMPHNAGVVAAELKANAPERVVGGWKAIVTGSSAYKVL